jgi:hypothetical protein
MTGTDPLEARLNRALAEYVARSEGPWDAPRVARELGVLPAFYDWTAFGGVRLDGEVVWVEYDPPHAVARVEDLVHRNTILHHVARSNPSLGDLDPVRPAGAADCPACGGTGVAQVDGVPADERVVCFCGGLGWLPPGVKYPVYPSSESAASGQRPHRKFRWFR